MKTRNGFVSNSSSCSYTIYYKEGGLLRNAQEILDHIKKNKNTELYLLGKELGEGNDFTVLTSNMKKMIIRFEEEWLRNGDKVKALVSGNNLFYMKSEYDRGSYGADIESYPHSFEFNRDNRCFEGESSLEDFYVFYITDDYPDGEYEVAKLSNVKPYAIIHRDKFTIENEKQWESVIECPDSYPLVITKRDRDKDFIRTLQETNGVSDYEISYMDAFFFPNNEESKEFLKGIYDKVHKKGVVVYTDAVFCNNQQNPFMYPLVFHVEPLFGVYKLHEKEKLRRIL